MIVRGSSYIDHHILTKGIYLLLGFDRNICFLLLEDSRPVSLQKQEPILLWWYEDGMPHDTNIKKSHKIECPSGRACIVSCDRSLKNNPGTVAYIFYGTSFSANDLPLPRNLDDVWALLHEESPKNNWLFSHEDGIRYRMIFDCYDNLVLYHFKILAVVNLGHIMELLGNHKVSGILY